MIKITFDKEGTYEWYKEEAWKLIKKNHSTFESKFNIRPRQLLTDITKLNSVLSKDKYKEPEIQNFLQSEEIQSFWNYVCSISKEDMQVILTVPINQIKVNYSNIYNSISKYIELADKYAERLRNNRFNDSYSDEDKSQDIKILALNCALEKLISYDLLTDRVRRDMVGRMKVKVCPYCNQSFVYSLPDPDWKPNGIEHYGQYLGDLDHLLPKSVYQLFSMSIWNLIPCCKSCNQLFKRSNTRELLNPLERGFGKDCRYQIKWTSDLTPEKMIGEGKLDRVEMEWKVSPYLKFSNDQENKKISELIENNIEVFKLNQLYSLCEDVVRDTLRRKYLFDNAYTDYLQDIFLELGITTVEEQNRILYGTSRSENKFQNELHGKMMNDILGM